MPTVIITIFYQPINNVGFQYRRYFMGRFDFADKSINAFAIVKKLDEIS
jgi:hypothetical protein